MFIINELSGIPASRHVSASNKKADNPVIGSLPMQRRVPDQTTTAVPLMLTISMLPFCPTTS